MQNPVFKQAADKRLSIDLASLRQHLWLDKDGNQRDELTSRDHDQIIWVDTSCMLADPLTKAMNATLLVKTMKTGKMQIIREKVKRSKTEANAETTETTGW